MTQDDRSLLESLLKETARELGNAREGHRAELDLEEVGVVNSVSQGVAVLSGISGIKSEELMVFPGDRFGMVFNIDHEELGIVLLDNSAELHAGSEAYCTGRVLDVPVGEELIGRVVDAVGRPVDNKGPIRSSLRLTAEREAPAIMDRDPVTVPLQTGVKVVDALIPIGRGQRELILGDRQTGKTAVALSAIMNQRGTGVICIYCAIAKQAAAVAKVVEDLRSHEAMEYSLVLAATAEETPGLQFVAPYVATAMGEFFMEQGRDVIIVYDDLTCHARSYRELSLLLRRPPGREAFPGDIFHIHSRLLERSTHLRSGLGGGSMTALPIAETEAQNIAGYIPTNLISITDGQIYLSPRLFQRGVLPAIDVGKSVSRVGGKSQLSAYRSIVGDLRLSYAQFEELEAFSRFGTKLDEQTRRSLERGARVREVLKQSEYELVSVPEQVAVFVALNAGILDEVPLTGVAEAEQAIRNTTLTLLPELCDKISKGDEMGVDDQQAIKAVASDAVNDSKSEQTWKQRSQ